MSKQNEAAAQVLEKQLRAFVSDLDYDIHKNLECDEETEEDRYPELAENFLAALRKAGWTLVDGADAEVR